MNPDAELERILAETKALDGAEVPPPPTPQEPPPPTPIKKAQSPKRAEDASSFKRAGWFRGALERMMPDASRVKFYKRDGLGKMQLIPRSYGIKDLEQAQDVEEFIMRFLMPNYGPGDYEVTLINAKGEEQRTSSITVLGQEMTPMSPDTKAIDTLISRVRELEGKPTEKPIKLSDQLAELKAMQEMFGGKEGGGGNLMMMMMMLDKMQQPRVGGGGELAEIKSALADLRREQHHALPPPLPIPMPPAETVDVQGLVKTIAETMKQPAAPVPASTTATLASILGVVKDAAPILRSMLGLDQIDTLKHEIQTIRNQPSKGLKESLEDVAAINKLMNQNQPRQSESDNFWSVFNNLVMNAEAVGSAVARIRAADKLAERGMLKPTGETGGSVEGGDLSFPPGFETWVNKIEAAIDNAGRIEATLRAFQFLGKNAKWRPYLIKVVKLAKSGTPEARKEILEFVDNFLAGLKDNSLLPDATVEATKQAFAQNLDQVIAMVTGKPA